MGKKSDNQSHKKTSIGGQAVLEGVMMRGKTAMATAVRDADGVIRIESERLVPPEKKPLIVKIPIIRGAVNFFSSMITGTKTLMRSAEVYGGEEEPSKFEKWLSEKLHIEVMNVVMTLGVILGLGLAILLFVMCPQLIANLICDPAGLSRTGIWYNLIEGLIRILIFVGYILSTSLIKDIRRTYMYHGAEHKTISCYEKGLELTPENAKKCTRVHNRCGTTFMFFVMLISILVFSLANSFLGVVGFWRILLKIALLPVVAGLSYELLKALAKTDFWLFYPIKAPGLLLQRITTKEPTEDMLEVAIAAFKTVLAMDEDQAISAKKFVTAQKTNELNLTIAAYLAENGVTEQSESQWIVSRCTGVKRSEVETDETLQKPSVVEQATAFAKERAGGRPLWYVFGDADFYGYTFKVDERVLIPRPETEELCEIALKCATKNDKILDLCTGSGALAVVLNKKTSASVTASDISEDALCLARQNAAANNAQVDFVKSDMFGDIEGKFSIIVSNPPYIPTSDIDGLEREVKDHEPLSALDGGEDGLRFYRIIAAESPKYLFDGGLLILECGVNEAEAVKLMLSDKFSSVEIIKDFAGIERFVKACK